MGGGRQDSYIVFRWKIVINGDWWVIVLLYVEVKMGNLDNWTPRFKSLSIDFENLPKIPRPVDTVGLSCHLCTVKYYWENIDKKFSLNIWLSKLPPPAPWGSTNLRECFEIMIVGKYGKFLCTGLKSVDRDRTRTCNPQIRSLVPYPLGHTTLDTETVLGVAPCSQSRGLQAGVQSAMWDS